jgi:hypothetical protein
MAAAFGFAPDGSDAALVFSLQPGSFNDGLLITFLTELRELLNGDKATVIWDGLSSHRSKTMTASTSLAHHRATARLRTRTQSGRTGLGQRQRSGTRQPLPGHHRGGGIMG